MLFCLHRRFSSFFAAAAIATAALSAAQTLQQRPAAKAAPAVEPMPLQVDGKPELPVCAEISHRFIPSGFNSMS
jgi:hypothetical protein